MSSCDHTLSQRDKYPVLMNFMRQGGYRFFDKILLL